eukprot:g10184.t1 g10184   contig4:1386953-1388368(+)
MDEPEHQGYMPAEDVVTEAAVVDAAASQGVVVAAAAAAAVGGGGGIVVREQDILFGRGGGTNRHKGNLRYRSTINNHRQEYNNASKADKPKVSRRIVKAIRVMGGRFLKREDNSVADNAETYAAEWVEVSEKEAACKVSQAFREKTRWTDMKGNASVSDGTVQVDVSASVPTLPSPVRRLHPIPTMQPTALMNANAATMMFSGDAKGAIVQHAQKKRKRSDAQKKAAHAESTAAKSAVVNAESEAKKEKSGESDSIQIQISVPPVPSLPNLMTNGNAVFGNNTPTVRNEDVLFGRGGRTNHHPGNKRLRDIVDHYRVVYTSAKKIDKPKVAKMIVSALRNSNPPTRFLRMNVETSRWEDVGDRRAAEKVSQALREKERGEQKENSVAVVESDSSVQNEQKQKVVAAAQALPSPIAKKKKPVSTDV